MAQVSKWRVETMGGTPKRMIKTLRNNAAFYHAAADLVEGLCTNERQKRIKRIKETALLLVCICWTVTALLLLGAREFGIL